jgi:hypothetical protein
MDERRVLREELEKSENLPSRTALLTRLAKVDRDDQIDYLSRTNPGLRQRLDAVRRSETPRLAATAR